MLHLPLWVSTGKNISLVCVFSVIYSSRVTKDQCHCSPQCFSWIHPFFLNTIVSISILAGVLYCSSLFRVLFIWKLNWDETKSGENTEPPLHPSSLLDLFQTSSPVSLFFFALPPTEAGELMLSGRALWSHVHLELSCTHTSQSPRPLKAQTPACSYISLKRSGGHKNEQSAACSMFGLPFTNTSTIAAGTLRITVAQMHSRCSLMEICSLWRNAWILLMTAHVFSEFREEDYPSFRLQNWKWIKESSLICATTVVVTTE